MSSDFYSFTKPKIYKMRTAIIAIFFLSNSFLSCQNQKKVNSKQIAIQTANPIQVPLENGYAKAYFASGCFWCVEAIYESLKGVKEVINGYAGGHTDSPSYSSSNTGRTGHAEAVEVIYDPNVISFSDLLDVYFGSQNISQVNGQGPDRGSQYRSIIFFQNQEQKTLILDKKEEIAKVKNTTVAAEVYPFLKFWKAENYHQNYERLHPNNPYVRNVSIPRLRKFQKKFPELLKSVN